MRAQRAQKPFDLRPDLGAEYEFARYFHRWDVEAFMDEVPHVTYQRWMEHNRWRINLASSLAEKKLVSYILFE